MKKYKYIGNDKVYLKYLKNTIFIKYRETMNYSYYKIISHYGNDAVRIGSILLFDTCCMQEINDVIVVEDEIEYV